MKINIIAQPPRLAGLTGQSVCVCVRVERERERGKPKNELRPGLKNPRGERKEDEKKQSGEQANHK